MIALLQRVSWARLKIAGDVRGEIDKGLVVFLGIEKEDDEQKADRLLHKILSYRVFADSEERMNLSLLDIKGDLLLVSQFTLAATTDKGLRPGFSSAMAPALAEPLYDYVVRQANVETVIKLATGEFGADMKVALENDGPVTFLLKL